MLWSCNLQMHAFYCPKKHRAARLEQHSMQLVERRALPGYITSALPEDWHTKREKRRPPALLKAPEAAGQSQLAALKVDLPS